MASHSPSNDTYRVCKYCKNDDPEKINIGACFSSDRNLEELYMECLHCCQFTIVTESGMKLKLYPSCDCGNINERMFDSLWDVDGQVFPNVWVCLCCKNVCGVDDSCDMSECEQYLRQQPIQMEPCPRCDNVVCERFSVVKIGEERFGLQCMNCEYIIQEELDSFSEYETVAESSHYKISECNSPEDVLAKARSQLGDRSYHLMFNNCEHFTRRAKINRNSSLQVKAAYKTAIKTVSNLAVKTFSSSKAAPPAVVAVFIEAVSVLKAIWAANEQLKRGEISKRHFTRIMIKRGTQCVFTLGLSFTPLKFVTNPLVKEIGGLVGKTMTDIFNE